jgi:hypothetical protein
MLDLATLGVRERIAARRARARLGRGSVSDDRWRPEAEDLLRLHLRTVRRAASFELWERIFSAWHVLHFPLTAALFLAAAVHVLAVHLY